MDNSPKHIAIICDGNRRWARSKNLPVNAGHIYSAEHVFFSLVEEAARMKIPYITFWVLSTENEKKRSKAEMAVLFKLMKLHFRKDLPKIMKKNVRVRFIGNIDGLPTDLQSIVQNMEQETKGNTAITATFALNYGGRDEILRALKKAGPNQLKTEVDFSTLLDTVAMPDPDLIVRTGGEHRLSGFMPWQAVYSELFFVDTLFPDFTNVELKKIIDTFITRERRFGK